MKPVRVSSVHHDERLVDAFPYASTSSSDNVFAALVGKNGAGKSRLFAKVVSDAVRLCGKWWGHELPYSDESGPTDIAAYTRPFDRFPSPQKTAPKRRSPSRSFQLRPLLLLARRSPHPTGWRCALANHRATRASRDGMQ